MDEPRSIIVKKENPILCNQKKENFSLLEKDYFSFSAYVICILRGSRAAYEWCESKMVHFEL